MVNINMKNNKNKVFVNIKGEIKEVDYKNCISKITGTNWFYITQSELKIKDMDYFYYKGELK